MTLVIVGRDSFDARLFHSLLAAGLSRRTNRSRGGVARQNRGAHCGCMRNIQALIDNRTDAMVSDVMSATRAVASTALLKALGGATTMPGGPSRSSCERNVRRRRAGPRRTAADRHPNPRRSPVQRGGRVRDSAPATRTPKRMSSTYAAPQLLRTLRRFSAWIEWLRRYRYYSIFHLFVALEAPPDESKAKAT